MTWTIWLVLMRAVESLKICTLMGYVCRKYVYNVWAKKIQRTCVVKNDLWFQKWHKEFGEFSQEKLIVMLDTSSVYKVLAEKNVFFGQKYPMEFQLFGLSTACLKLSKFLWFLKPGLCFCINFAPFCNIVATTLM